MNEHRASLLWCGKCRKKVWAQWRMRGGIYEIFCPDCKTVLDTMDEEDFLHPSKKEGKR